MHGGGVNLWAGLELFTTQCQPLLKVSFSGGDEQLRSYHQ